MAVVIKTVPIDLDANTRYAIRIRSINSFGVSSDWSEGLIVSTTDDAGAPSSPDAVTISAYLRSIIVRWTPVTDNDLAKYEIHVEVGSADFIPNSNTLVGIVAQSNTFVITKYWNGASYVNLVPGVSYTVRIRSIDTAGNASAYSSWTSVALTDDLTLATSSSNAILTSSGTLELTNATSAYIDFKNNTSDDYDVRIAYTVLTNGLIVTSADTAFTGDVEVDGDLTVNGMPLGIAGLAVQPSAANKIGLVVRGQPGQTAALQAWSDSSDSAVAYITPSGVFHGFGTGLTLLDADTLSQGTVPAGRLSGTYNIDITGSVAVAGHLATPHLITLNGDVSGSVGFDGSADVTMAVTVANDSHEHDGRYYTESESDNLFVSVSGDTMSGPLIIAATPTSNSQVANKLYVDMVSSEGVSSILSAEDPLPQYHNNYRGDLRYPSKEQLEALLGDLLFVGLFDAENHDHTINTYPKPIWGPPGALNLISNSSFERDAYEGATPYFLDATPTSPADYVADLWRVWIRGTDAARSYTPTSTTDWAFHGTYSQKIEITGTVGNTDKTSFGSLNPIEINPSTYYTLSAYGKASAANKGRLSIRWLTSGLVEISDSYTSYFSDSTHDRVITSVISPPTAAFCTIEFEIGGATPTVGDWIQVDAVQLEMSSSVSDYSPKTDEQYRHGMYWIVSSTGQVSFLDTDYSGRLEVAGGDNPVTLANGDWIISLDPNIGATPSDRVLSLDEITFQYIPYSTETFIKTAISQHTQLYTDPATPTTFTDPHPQYLRESEADLLYSDIIHNHDGDLFESISNHTRDFAISVVNKAVATPDDIGLVTLTTVSDHGFTILEGINVTGLGDPLDGSWIISSIPASDQIVYSLATPAIYTASTPASGLVSYDAHILYLRKAEADIYYSDILHNHDSAYEVVNSVANHAAEQDAHPQYLKIADAVSDYASIVHRHDDLYLPIDHIFTSTDEVQSTDGAGSSVIYIGSATPNAPSVGDIWFETFNVSLTAPAATKNLTAIAGSTSMVISWDAWSSSVEQSNVTLQRTTYADGAWASATTILNQSGTPGVTTFSTSYTDTGLTEKTQYRYRVRAVNSIGTGTFTADIVPTTTNATPSAPTISGTTPSTTSIILSWTNTTSDQRAANTYEVFKDNVSQGYTTSTSYNFTGLTENASYTLGVKVWDKGDLPSNDGSVNSLASALSTTVGTCSNANPPDVSGLTATVQSYNQIKVDWTAVGGISDLSGYRVRLYLTSGLVLQQTITTTNVTYTFTGLSYSTGYTVKVDAYDTGSLYSVTLASATATTQASPDSTAPTTPVITSFQPYSVYGQMQLIVTWYNDATSNPTYGTIQYRKNSGSWTTYLNAGNVTGLGSQTYTNIVTGVAGDVIEVKVWSTDSLGNTNSASPATSSYTLITSPSYITADSTNDWQASSSYSPGAYNTNGDWRPMSGYWSDVNYRHWGLWYYGTKPEAQLKNSGRRTIVSGRIFMQRNSAGTSAGMYPHIYLTAETASPGNARSVAAPATYGTETALTNQTLRTPAIGGSTYYAWMDLPGSGVSSWAKHLVAGTYRGICVRYASGAAQEGYASFDSTVENANTGKLEFTHLG